MHALSYIQGLEGAGRGVIWWGKVVRQDFVGEIEDRIPRIWYLKFKCMPQVSFSGKPTLRQTLVCKRLIRSTWGSTPREGRKTKQDWVRHPLRWPWLIPQGALKLEWPFTVVPSWVEMVSIHQRQEMQLYQFLCSHHNHTLQIAVCRWYWTFFFSKFLFWTIPLWNCKHWAH